MSTIPGFTKIGEFGDLNFLTVLQTRLDAAGIEFVLLDENRASMAGYPMLTGGWGFGPRLFIRDDQVQDALALLD